MALFETLYESGLYWQFLGVNQFIAGTLLLTQRFATLGAIIFLPISINIFVITLSYYFAYTPVVTGILLLLNLFLIFWDWNKLKILFNYKYIEETYIQLDKDNIWFYTGLVLCLFTFIYRKLFDNYNVFSWGLFSLLIALVGFLIWRFNVKHLNKAN